MTDELKPCPFCGKEPNTFKYNGTLQAQCQGDHKECAGSDVVAPIAMWNTRTPTPANVKARAERYARALGAAPQEGAPETIDSRFPEIINAWIDISFGAEADGSIEGEWHDGPVIEGTKSRQYTRKDLSDARIAEFEAALASARRELAKADDNFATARNEALEAIAKHFELFETLESEGIVMAIRQYIADVEKYGEA